MGSSFEDLDARNATVKTIRGLDARFMRKNILKKETTKKAQKSQVVTSVAHKVQHLSLQEEVGVTFGRGAS
jgi:hypothetical protein